MNIGPAHVDLERIAICLVLLAGANSAPILARKVMGQRWEAPVDMGLELGQGKRLLGSHKTWRGLMAAVGASVLLSFPLSVSAWEAGLFGLLSMAGDLFSGGTKRRLGIASGGRFLVLDQVPESAVPMLAMGGRLGCHWPDIVAVIILFTLGQVVFSPLLYWLRIRRNPH